MVITLADLMKSLRYTFHIYSHPFDGFWFMKAEKRGTVKTGLVFLALLLITTAIRIYTTGYLLSDVTLTDFSVWLMMAGIVGVVLLYCVANWALTTLLDGKGTFGEIFTALMYSVTPIILVNLPLALISNVISAEEVALYNFVNIVSFGWALFLLLVGNLSIHDFSMTKSILTFLLTIVCMLIIVVIGILFVNLCQQVYIWVESIVTEIAYRL